MGPRVSLDLQELAAPEETRVTQEPAATMALPAKKAMSVSKETLALQVAASCTAAEVDSLSWCPFLKACRCRGKKRTRRTARSQWRSRCCYMFAYLRPSSLLTFGYP